MSFPPDPEVLEEYAHRRRTTMLLSLMATGLVLAALLFQNGFLALLAMIGGLPMTVVVFYIHRCPVCEKPLRYDPFFGSNDYCPYCGAPLQ